MIRKLTKTGEKLLEYFLKHPTEEKHIRGLSEETGISYSSVRKALGELRERELVKERKESKMIFYRAYLDSGRFKEVKQLYNLQLIRESGLVEELEKEFRPDAIILFGSFLEGTDREDSDVDIAIVNGRDVSADLGPFEAEFNRKFQLVQVEDATGEQEEFRNTLANGLVLSGYLKVV